MVKTVIAELTCPVGEHKKNNMTWENSGAVFEQTFFTINKYSLRINHVFY